MKLQFLLIAALATSAVTLNAQSKYLDVIGSENTSWDEIDATENDSKKFEGTNWYNAPVIPLYYHSGMQMLYSADKLQEMAGKDITSITFKYYNEYPLDYTASPKFYFTEVDENEFVYDDVVSFYKWFPINTEATPNGQATLELSLDDYYASAEFKVPLSTPYHYTGKNLLIVAATDNDIITDQSMGYFAFHSYYDSWKDEANKVRYKRIAIYASDDTDFITDLKQDNYLNIDGYERIDMELPVIRFEYSDNGGVAENAAIDAKVAGINGAVSVAATDAARVEIYNIAGQQLVNEAVAAGNHEFALQAGLYLVKVNGKAVKVVVR